MTTEDQFPGEFRRFFDRMKSRLDDFFEQADFAPEKGTIRFGEDRYLLMRAESMSVGFFDLVQSLYRDKGRERAFAIAHNLLFDISHGLARSDAQAFGERLGADKPEEQLVAGPLHFAHTGWGVVHIHEESHPTPDEDFLLVYDHENSFEADSWLNLERQTDVPICVMNAGYSSGWCAECTGVELVATEILCRARGDDCCRFIMAPPDRIEQRVEQYLERTPEMPREVDPDVPTYELPGFFKRKTIEAELRSKDAQLARADRLASLGTLAAGIAHEINNPLSFIISNIDYSLGELEDPETSDIDEIRVALEQAKKGAERVKRTVQDLRTFSHGGQDDEITAVDVADIVEFAVDMIEKTAEGTDVEITRHLEEARPVRANASRLSQVIVNLLVNASQAMGSNGPHHIDVTVEDFKDDRVLVEVSDTGEGIPPDVQDRIFDPFYTTKPTGEGTGLGLAICHQIVDAIGGTISVDSTPGAGTTVRVLLPAADE